MSQDLRKIEKIYRHGDADVRCPLCLKFFEKMFDGIRRIFIYACHTDKVAIACNDPLVNDWGRLTHNNRVPCPNCNADMRVFATSTGFFVANCYAKGCGASIRKTDPDRKAGVLVIPPTEKHGPEGQIDRPIAASADDISGVPFAAEPGQEVTQ